MADMAWPTEGDLLVQIQARAPLQDAQTAALVTALEAATQWIADRCGLSRTLLVLVDDVLDVVPTTIPAPVHQAILLYAAKLYARKDSPHGIAGTGEFGVIRTGRYDSDAEQLLGPYLALPGIA